jgi:hypothetical protein
MFTTALESKQRPRQASLAPARDSRIQPQGLQDAGNTGQRDPRWQRLIQDARARMTTGLDAEQELLHRRNASGQ